jgi:hypothetical protein
MLFMGSGERSRDEVRQREQQFGDCYSMLSGLQQFGLQGSGGSPEQFAQEEQELRDKIGTFLKNFAADFDLLIDWQEKAELIED